MGAILINGSFIVQNLYSGGPDRPRIIGESPQRSSIKRPVPDVPQNEGVMSIRPVKRLVKAKPTLEGAGVHLRRAFGFGNTVRLRSVSPPR